MTPDIHPSRRSPRHTSGWALRRTAEAAGRTVSDQQLDRFAEWGLLERDGNGYAADSAERLAAVLDATEDARLLPRRVVQLRADHGRFPIRAEPLRRAFVELAPTIRRPVRKLQLVAAAWAAMGEAASGQTPRGRRRGRLPKAEGWGPLIKSTSLGSFETRVTSWYRLAIDVLPVYSRELGIDLEGIPVEERVVMVAVLDLHGKPSK